MPSPIQPPHGLALDRGAAIPVHRQIYQSVRDAVGSGMLSAGERLPRHLASQPNWA